MSRQILKKCNMRHVVAVAVLLLLGRGWTQRGQACRGQDENPAPKKAPTTAKAQALIDLTGYWVSIVNEDWRWRMMTPAKGDYASVPLNAEGKRVADTWDPAKDEREGNNCRAYGAGNILRIPERLHVTWENDNTSAHGHRRRHADASVPF